MFLKNFSFFLLAAFLFSCNNASKGPAPQDGAAPENNTAPAPAQPSQKKNIVFFGNSLTAAYGLDPSEGYVALIQQRLDSLGLPYKAINAGLSGETTAGGRERVNWVIQQPLDIFVLELGGNDALRGIEPSATYENLEAIVQTVKGKYPDSKIVLAGMEAPPNMGQKYTSQFRQVYADLAKKHQLALIPFFLANVGGVPELNQADQIHPNKQGQYILRENVWQVLEGLLEK
jgi:acyl-CoA thioesterase-1